MLKRVWRLFGKPDTTAVATSVPTVTVRADDDNDSTVSTAFVMPFEIRPIEPEDGDALRQLFRQSVEQIGSKYYDATATAVWAQRADEADFVSDLQRGLTLVAILHGERVGFAQLHPANHIEMLYLSPAGSGLGIATLLCQHLEDEARIAGSTMLYTASSLAARRFFESMGFRLSGEETVQRHGVAIDRLRMEKTLVTG
jgi:putative acetyltransferase